MLTVENTTERLSSLCPAVWSSTIICKFLESSRGQVDVTVCKSSSSLVWMDGHWTGWVLIASERASEQSVDNPEDETDRTAA